jgi:hypothetical protein
MNLPDARATSVLADVSDQQLALCLIMPSGLLIAVRVYLTDRIPK